MVTEDLLPHMMIVKNVAFMARVQSFLIACFYFPFLSFLALSQR
jgi:hypothetical protein